MTEERFRNFTNNINYDNSKFRELAEVAVDVGCTNLDGTKLTGTARDNLIEVRAWDFKIGSEYTKTKYLVGGSILGAVSVIGIFTIKRILDRRKKEES